MSVNISHEIFTIGSVVTCVDCFKTTIEGVVLAFDQKNKMLILKCISDKLSDIFIVNLSLCSDVEVKNEACTLPEPPLSLNLQRLSSRVRNQVEKKKRLVSALGQSPDGQKLFLSLAKTLDKVKWSGSNIVVFNEVTITPPYKVDNVLGNPDSADLKYVKKLVNKHSTDIVDGIEEISNQNFSTSFSAN